MKFPFFYKNFFTQEKVKNTHKKITQFSIFIYLCVSSFFSLWRDRVREREVERLLLYVKCRKCEKYTRVIKHHIYELYAREC